MKLKSILVALALTIGLTGCTDEPNAARILEANGFTDIQFTGYAWMSCSEKDTYQTGFTATGPTGKRVEGAVCAGMFFKNSTIRFD